MKISCIVAAYNEERRIGTVLSVLQDHPLIDEIIVVDDGSTDNTHAVLSTFSGIQVITQPKNMGKSRAVSTGLEASHSDIVMLIDADLLGLRSIDISNLIDPVLHNLSDTSISLRKNAPVVWRMIGLDYISGERVFYKKILEGQYENLSKLRGFGLEVFLNNIFIKNKSRISIVSWPTVDSPEKFKKYGLISGMLGEVKMFTDIFKTISFSTAIRQIIIMTKLRVRLD